MTRFTTEELIHLGLIKGPASLWHPQTDCEPEFCCIHNPSDHPLKFSPLIFRGDRSPLMERKCTHGIGHPDPDSLGYIEKMFPYRPTYIEGIHGCDGCCQKPQPIATKKENTITLDSIVWTDSGMSFVSEWTDVDTAVERAKNWNGTANTTGFVIYENDDIVVLAQTLDNELGNVTHCFLIHKKAILGRETLREVEWNHASTT